eukprot:3176516-Pyramimonas_sp.AAC.1
MAILSVALFGAGIGGTSTDGLAQSLYFFLTASSPSRPLPWDRALAQCEIAAPVLHEEALRVPITKVDGLPPASSFLAKRSQRSQALLSARGAPTRFQALPSASKRFPAFQALPSAPSASGRSQGGES